MFIVTLLRMLRLHRFQRCLIKISVITTIICLSACGGGGGSKKDSSNDTNQPPVANAGSDQIVTGVVTVNLSGSGSDSDGSVVGYQWQQMSGMSASLNNANQAVANFGSPAVTSSENLVFRLTVTDDDGDSSSDDVTVTVNPIAASNQAPVANAGVDQSVTETDMVNLVGSGSDSDGTIVSYQWQQTSGTTVTLNDANMSTAFFAAPNVTGSENFEFRLTVTDNGGATGSDLVDVTVNDQCTPSTAHDMARANSYDNAWQAEWVDSAKTVINTPIPGISKTQGKVLEVGDSMTYSYAYGLWARNPNGATTSDAATTVWMRANVNDGSNGFDWSSGGITAQDDGSWFHGFVGSIPGNPDLNDAQFAVIMFNTPDCSNPNNLDVILDRVNEFRAAGIVPILSTIPPRTDFNYNNTCTYPFNDALLAFAEQHSLPIIDYETEIQLRRPNNTWADTLISGDGVHPSGDRNGYTAESNPYSNGGDAATHTTGDAALNSGYLLRTWLTVQKMKEIKKYVVDNQPIPPLCN